jgi:hypothetical protein
VIYQYVICQYSIGYGLWLICLHTAGPSKLHALKCSTKATQLAQFCSYHKLSEIVSYVQNCRYFGEETREYKTKQKCDIPLHPALYFKERNT